MILFLFFLILGFIFSGLYILDKDKFSPANLLLAVWLVSIGLSRLRLSEHEKPWTIDFWLILAIFLVLFYLSFTLTSRLMNKKILVKEKLAGLRQLSWPKPKLFFFAITFLALSAFGANLFIFWQFGTMPLFSTSPDKMRFIINKNIFGHLEYLALLPRLYIPLIFFYLLSVKKVSHMAKFFLWLNIFLGFGLLFLYASRLVIILPILLSYFIYLYSHKDEINLKKIMTSSMVVLAVVSIISVSLPAFRNYITYKDYYAETDDYTPFTYLANLADLNLPANLNWLTPLYIIPSFNLQAMLQATTFYNSTVNNFYGGGYYASVFNPLLKIVHWPLSNVVIPWEPMFLSWWITATFLFTAWADFGYGGIIFISIFWGLILAWAYQYATKKPTYWSIMLMSYLSFVVIMSIYTDYLMRVEFYLDMAFIALTNFIFYLFGDWFLLRSKLSNKIISLFE